MDLAAKISKTLKTVGKVIDGSEKDLVVTKMKANVSYNPTTGSFNKVNSKTYRVKGIVTNTSQNQQDLQRQRQQTKLVLIAYKDLPVEIETSDKVNFDKQDYFITEASLDAASALHRLNVRSG